MIADELEAIESENLQQLRERWARRWGTCPRLRSVALLRHIVAWRLQVEASGGLDATTRRMLLGRAAGAETQLTNGTVLTREWLGTTYRVEVADDTFIHAGRR